ncbi:hypothetical protein SAMN03159371_07179 [Variovorax sp. NFACC28]|nr:hypothetical protein SAMN03159371_07179 [Variovorax sp. NFACC28]SEG97711.1 hypothetical protein SAMN03159365_06987 [Variovorax sp. NFACC29]SFD99920.1 hypothetical protein SAMN03159379_07008 [Variovorax sp. NFACC26]SFH27771.1 hypothetical protein SAMN03159447_07621 [Variovorax sp. NFACC27]
MIATPARICDRSIQRRSRRLLGRTGQARHVQAAALRGTSSPRTHHMARTTAARNGERPSMERALAPADLARPAAASCPGHCAADSRGRLHRVRARSHAPQARPQGRTVSSAPGAPLQRQDGTDAPDACAMTGSRAIGTACVPCCLLGRGQCPSRACAWFTQRYTPLHACSLRRQPIQRYVGFPIFLTEGCRARSRSQWICLKNPQLPSKMKFTMPNIDAIT